MPRGVYGVPADLTRRCPSCDQAFTPHQATQRYCSNRCRTAAHRLRSEQRAEADHRRLAAELRALALDVERTTGGRVEERGGPQRGVR